MYEILRKFTKGTNYLNMIFGNQRWMYIKDCQPKNNDKYFSKFFHTNKNSKHILFKCTYCDKYGHIIFWRKIMNQIRNELLKIIFFSLTQEDPKIFEYQRLKTNFEMQVFYTASQ